MLVCRNFLFANRAIIGMYYSVNFSTESTVNRWLVLHGSLSFTQCAHNLCWGYAKVGEREKLRHFLCVSGKRDEKNEDIYTHRDRKMILWIRLVESLHSGCIYGRCPFPFAPSIAAPILFIFCHFIAWQYIFHSESFRFFVFSAVELDDRRHHFALFSRTKWKLTCIILHVHKDVLNVLRFSVDIHIVVSLFVVVWIICYRHSPNGSCVSRVLLFFSPTFIWHTVNSLSIQHAQRSCCRMFCFIWYVYYFYFVIIFFSACIFLFYRSLARSFSAPQYKLMRMVWLLPTFFYIAAAVHVRELFLHSFSLDLFIFIVVDSNNKNKQAPNVNEQYLYAASLGSIVASTAFCLIEYDRTSSGS